MLVEILLVLLLQVHLEGGDQAWYWHDGFQAIVLLVFRSVQPHGGQLVPLADLLTGYGTLLGNWKMRDPSLLLRLGLR